MKRYIYFLKTQIQDLAYSFYENFTHRIRKREEELNQQIKQALRFALQSNEYVEHTKTRNRGLEATIQELRQSNSKLEAIAHESREQRDQAHNELKKYLPRTTVPRLMKTMRAIERCKAPVIYAAPDGTIVKTNIKEKIDLFGKNIRAYFVENKFPPASDITYYRDVKQIKVGRHVYKIQREREKVISEEHHGTIFIFRMVGTFETLMEKWYKIARDLHKQKEPKPQET